MQSDILADAEIEYLDFNDFEMPIYSPEREREQGIPARALDLFDRIDASVALLVAFAEHNGFVTAAWKNIFDWMSRIRMELWQGKPMALLAASPGLRAAAGVLASQELLAPHFGADLRDPATGLTTQWEHGKALSHEGSSITILATSADPRTEFASLVVVIQAESPSLSAEGGGHPVTSLTGSALRRFWMVSPEFSQEAAVNYRTELAAAG